MKNMNGKQLKKKSISFNQVPEEYRCHPLIVKTERKLGIRKIISKGYDIIQNKLFVSVFYIFMLLI